MFEQQLHGAWRGAGLCSAPHPNGSLTFGCPRCARPTRLNIEDGKVACPDCKWEAQGEPWEIAALGAKELNPTATSNNQIAPDFSAALITACDLAAMPMDKRPPLLGAWMKEGDLGYLFAPRGAGKSWMAMQIGNAVAEGLSLGKWEAGGGERSVIYFDAEMNLPDVQERAGMLGIESANFKWLSNEYLFVRGGQGVNIASLIHQAALSEMLPNGCLFIIDNLSTAQLGMAENDNDSFDEIRDWLLSLRHRRITVMIIHHAGRNGAMRGSSRREDMAHWIISLKDASNEDGEEKAFLTTFLKSRNCRAIEAPPLKWTMKQHNERIVFVCEPHSGPDALLAHIRDGVSRATELAELLGVQAGTISKWAKKLQAAKQIEIKRREYLPLE